MASTADRLSAGSHVARTVSGPWAGGESPVWGPPDGAGMQTTAPIQATGLGRVAAVAAIVATALGLFLATAPSVQAAPPTPAGGCGNTGC